MEQRAVIKFLEDDKKSGRSILIRTPDMIEKVCDFVANDRNASLKMMEEALNISRDTIRTILHKDLGKTKVCAKFVPHTLRSDQKSARINYSAAATSLRGKKGIIKWGQVGFLVAHCESEVKIKKTT
ncbi:GVQW3 protein, partial [Acromyrmex heyeri]